MNTTTTIVSYTTTAAAAAVAVSNNNNNNNNNKVKSDIFVSFYSLIQLKKVNAELKKESDEKEREISRLTKLVEDTFSASKLAAAQKKIVEQDEEIQGVCQLVYIFIYY